MSIDLTPAPSENNINRMPIETGTDKTLKFYAIIAHMSSEGIKTDLENDAIALEVESIMSAIHALEDSRWRVDIEPDFTKGLVKIIFHTPNDTLVFEGEDLISAYREAMEDPGFKRMVNDALEAKQQD
jgi:hypothetical protein